MGLFNSIKLSTPPDCPICGKQMKEEMRNGDWQSKETAIDGEWVDNVMNTYPIERMTEGEIHGLCEHCDSFVELFVQNGKIVGGGIR